MKYLIGFFWGLWVSALGIGVWTHFKSEDMVIILVFITIPLAVGTVCHVIID